MWQAIYNSPWHHPFASWLATGALALWLWLRGQSLWPRLRAFVGVFALEMALDAWWTGGWAPVPASHPLSQPLAILFVILGDYRFFALVELQRSPGARGWLVGLGWTMVVPLLHGLCIRLFPHLFADLRVVFLAYEVAQAAVVGLWWRQRGAGLPEQVRPWLAAVTTFELAQYLLWATADVVILAGLEVGHGLRLLPNLMYYAGFLAFVVWRSPRPAPAQ